MSKIDVTIERWRYIGGSDLKTIMRLDTFKTRYDLLLEKCQYKEPDIVENEYTIDGHINEELIRNYYNSTRFKNDNLVENQVISDDEVYRYNADGVNSQIVWECKRVGKTTFDAINNVRDKENKKYLVQLLKGMKLNNKQYGLLTISLRNGNFDKTKIDELKEFEINIDDFKDILEEIDIEVSKFLEDKDKLLKNPFLTEEELLPVDLTELSDKLIVLEIQLNEYKQLEKEYKDMKQRLYEAMDKNDIKKWTTNSNFQITKVDGKEDEEIEETYFDEEKFMFENPELYTSYLAKRKKVKKGTSGYVRISPPKE